MIRELCEYIETNTSFIVGTDLSAISVDSDRIDRCVVVTEPAPGLVDGLLTDKRQIPLTAYSRALTKFTARGDAYTVFNLLHGATQISIGPIGSGAIYVCNIECRTPYYMGMDETNRRHQFAMPFDVNVTNML